MDSEEEFFVIPKKNYQAFFSNLEKENVIIPKEKFRSLISCLEDLERYVGEPKNQWKRKSERLACEPKIRKENRVAPPQG